MPCKFYLSARHHQYSLSPHLPSRLSAASIPRASGDRTRVAGGRECVYRIFIGCSGDNQESFGIITAFERYAADRRHEYWMGR
ncbi:hypothetical protein KCP73_23895 [Salmonella enterica subsp. enterica]|nr:hypothetical protein KCP73_23895 [Salmonella enterica subsp. enterica]